MTKVNLEVVNNIVVKCDIVKASIIFVPGTGIGQHKA